MERMGNPFSPENSAISLDYLMGAWNDLVRSAGSNVGRAVDYHLHRKVAAEI
jgi:hypothetical protein